VQRWAWMWAAHGGRSALTDGAPTSGPVPARRGCPFWPANAAHHLSATMQVRPASSGRRAHGNLCLFGGESGSCWATPQADFREIMLARSRSATCSGHGLTLTTNGEIPHSQLHCQEAGMSMPRDAGHGAIEMQDQQLVAGAYSGRWRTLPTAATCRGPPPARPTDACARRNCSGYSGTALSLRIQRQRRSSSTGPTRSRATSSG
jgi:hypothetical protein